MHRIPLACLVFVACAATEPVPTDRVRGMGTLETSSTIKGRDGGFSGVWRGRSIWLYGDTILSLEGEDGSSWRHNSWSFTDDLDGADGLARFVERADGLGAPREFFPQTEDEAKFNREHSGDGCAEPCGARRILWPGPIVIDAERDRALVFYGKIYGEPGEWNFHGLGAGIAIWDDFANQPARPAIDVVPDEPTLLFGAEDGFGNAAIVAGDQLYAYACDGGFAKTCRIGRAPVADPLDRSKWSFFDGATWQRDIAKAEPVLEGGSMMSVHWSDRLGAYLAVYSKPLDARVEARIAPKPEGPWSNARVLFEAKASANGDAAYGALAHAEYAHDGWEVITYFRSPADWSGEIRVVEVKLEAQDFAE